MRISRNTYPELRSFLTAEFRFSVNKLREYVHYFFVRNDSDSRGRIDMAKVAAKAKAKKVPAKKAVAKKPVAAKKPVRKAKKAA